MQNKMSEETLAKIKELKDQIKELNEKVTESHIELEKLLTSNNCDFEGSYVEFYSNDDDEYVFMRVKRQTNRENGAILVLCGPAVRLCDSPLLVDEYDDEGIDAGSYNEHDIIEVGLMSLSGSSAETIRKITKKDMKFVLDYYFETIRKNLI